MIEMNITVPIIDELPSKYAARLGEYYALDNNQASKKEKGQFFTPIDIASLMSSFASVSDEKEFSILDPGCGTCILSANIIEYLVSNGVTSKINLDVYETDLSIIPSTNAALIYLKEWLGKLNITLKYTIIIEDFVLSNASVLTTEPNKMYDLIITNPPYFKLSKDDVHSIACKPLVNGQPNIYALFLGIAVKLLTAGGEVISINPKSFTAGKYFKNFRFLLLETVKIEKVHIFHSRTETFKKDNVLQEIIIFKASKRDIDKNTFVQITSSTGSFAKLDSFQKISIPYCQFVDLKSLNKTIHIPSTQKELDVLSLISTWKYRLIDFGVSISTGPVVSFRALEFLKKQKQNVNDVPLFWLQNVTKMQLEWPKKASDKEQYIVSDTHSRSILIPNKNYIFLRRMSAKDDSSRLIAAPYLCNYTKADFIGVENKLNYVYKKDKHLDRFEVVGLCALLNSRLFDQYFQMINGNINVSATELRDMKFPNIEVIKEIGKKIILSNEYSMENTNDVISSYFTENK